MADDRALAERVGARVEPAAGHAVERLGRHRVSLHDDLVEQGVEDDLEGHGAGHERQVDERQVPRQRQAQVADDDAIGVPEEADLARQLGVQQSAASHGVSS